MEASLLPTIIIKYFLIRLLFLRIYTYTRAQENIASTKYEIKKIENLRDNSLPYHPLRRNSHLTLTFPRDDDEEGSNREETA